MDFYTVLIFVHVLLFAGWFGGHLGVLALLRQARSPRLDPEHRGFTLRLAMRLDRIPRTAFALTPAVGLTLAQSWGSPVRGPYLDLLWLLTVVWVVFVWVVPRESETPNAQLMRKIALFGLVPLPALEIGEAMHRLRPALDELSGVSAPIPAKIARAIDIASLASLIIYGLLIAAAFIGATKPI